MKMGELVKIKHLIWTIAGMLVFAFSLGMNVNGKLNQVDLNKVKSEKNEKFITKIEVQLKNKEKSDNDNFILVLEKLHDIELQLKDKKDRE